MDVIRLGKRGQVSIPRSVMRRLGLSGGDMLLVDTSDDGAIVLRPAAVHQIETYDAGRIEEFLEEDEMAPEVAVRLRRRHEQQRDE